MITEAALKILSDAGHAAALFDDRAGSHGSLVVSLSGNENGSGGDLYIEPIPRRDGDRSDDMEILAVSRPYPLVFADLDAMSETIRLILHLNRLLPLGAHQFAEEIPAVYFSYHLATVSIAAIDKDVLLDTVGMVAFFSDLHGDLIDQVAHGHAGADEVIAELEKTGVRPASVFTTALGEVK